MSEEITRQLILAAGLIAACTFVHGIFVAAAAAVFRTTARRARGGLRFLRDSFFLVFLVMWLALAHAIEIALWAGAFVRIDAFSAWEPALYFSAASFTTLGFGDVLLPDEWRLLSGAAAGNGLLLFGVSAAFLFDVVARLRMAGDD